MENLSVWVTWLFLSAFVATLLLFFFSNRKPWRISGIVVLLCILQSVLAMIGFYFNTEALPPRFLLVFIPSAGLVVYGLLPKQRKWIHKGRKIEWSTFLHTIRVPVEVVLYHLSVNKLVPELMTFEGRNFDILMGITAPIMAFLFAKNLIGKRPLLVWNYIGLSFILFIFVNAVLSIESPIQQFAFDQPNRAVQYFPFVLLPVAIVPIVVWTHLSDIFHLKKLLRDSR